MDEYVEREKVENWLLTESASLDTQVDRECVVERMREDIPAVDVRPVVRSQWIKMKFFPNWECKKCGRVISEKMPDPWNHYHFCPKCGADMRGRTMREIEFRGKGISCPNEGKWLYGYYCAERTGTPDNPDELVHYIRKRCGINNPVDPATVGQFTGLTDKNGKRIYEGDIVRTKYGRLCYIGWFSSKEYNGFDLTPIVFNGDIDCPPPDKYDLYYSGNLEVVGNVYDNLDLMERTTFRSE